MTALKNLRRVLVSCIVLLLVAPFAIAIDLTCGYDEWEEYKAMK